MSEQIGIPNYFSMVNFKPDWLSYLKKGNITPVRRYTGFHLSGLLTVGFPVVDRILCLPFIVPQRIKLVNFNFRVQTAAVNSALAVALYNNDRKINFPTDLLFNFGEFPTTIAGIKSSIDFNITLNGDSLYWIAQWKKGNAETLNPPNLGKSFIMGYQEPPVWSGLSGIGFYFDQTYGGAWPNPFPGFTAGTRVIPYSDTHTCIFFLVDNP